MPRKSEFVLKDSPPELIKASGTAPRGRSYNGEIARNKPGAAKIDEILLGTKLAFVAVTDDEDGTLAKVSKLNPWHQEALKIITGSLEEAHKPLKHILFKHFGLELDHHIDISKLAGGRAVDTQGYIAHNDDIIVVAFRCTTSAFDWMTNLSLATSEWELDVDVAQGHSGYFSCVAGRCFGSGPKKPRVHDGFYNNILQTIPLLQKHVDPLLNADQPPRTLYVVGHSLGAGLSTLATCHFLLSHDWNAIPQRLINVSAGTPRSCKNSMASLIEEQLAELNPLGKASVFRVIMDSDVVCKLPSDKLGYSHIGKAIFLTEDGEVIVGPKLKNMARISEKELKKIKEDGDPALVSALESADDDKDEEEKGFQEKVKESVSGNTEEYQKLVSKIPKPLRDHCPDCYLEPLLKLYKNEGY